MPKISPLKAIPLFFLVIILTIGWTTGRIFRAMENLFGPAHIHAQSGCWFSGVGCGACGCNCGCGCAGCSTGPACGCGCTAGGCGAGCGGGCSST